MSKQINKKDIFTILDGLNFQNGVYTPDREVPYQKVKHSFMRNRYIAPYEKLVYLCIMAYKGSHTIAWPSKASIAEDLDVSSKTVERTIKKLQDKGALIVINRIMETNRRTSNMYILAPINDNGEFDIDSIDKFRDLDGETIRVAGK